MPLPNPMTLSTKNKQLLSVASTQQERESVRLLIHCVLAAHFIWFVDSSLNGDDGFWSYLFKGIAVGTLEGAMIFMQLINVENFFVLALFLSVTLFWTLFHIHSHVVEKLKTSSKSKLELLLISLIAICHFNALAEKYNGPYEDFFIFTVNFMFLRVLIKGLLPYDWVDNYMLILFISLGLLYVVPLVFSIPLTFLYWSKLIKKQQKLISVLKRKAL